jgi:hypothetical protein
MTVFFRLAMTVYNNMDIPGLVDLARPESANDGVATLTIRFDHFNFWNCLTYN